jgi:hypothetical protein
MTGLGWVWTARRVTCPKSRFWDASRPRWILVPFPFVPPGPSSPGHRLQGTVPLRPLRSGSGAGPNTVEASPVTFFLAPVLLQDEGVLACRPRHDLPPPVVNDPNLLYLSSRPGDRVVLGVECVQGAIEVPGEILLEDAADFSRLLAVGFLRSA